MVHRIVALLILGLATGLWMVFRRRLDGSSGLRWALRALVVMVWVQAGLGAATIWTNKAADVATAHVALGALTFSVTAMTYLVVRRTTTQVAEASAPAAVVTGAGLNRKVAQA
jgi:cytochrome c oxidase assembly protein subunit 15